MTTEQRRLKLEPRYLIDFDNRRYATIEDNALPVLAVVVGGKTTEIGVNIRHTRTENPHFESLRSEASLGGILLHRIPSAMRMIGEDASFSSLNMAKPHEVLFAVQGPDEIRALEDAADITLTTRVLKMFRDRAEQEELKPTAGVFYKLGRDVEAYKRLLQLLDAGYLGDPKEFQERFLEYARIEAKKRKAKRHQGRVRKLAESVEVELEKCGFPADEIAKKISDLTKIEGEVRKTLTEEELRIAYDDLFLAPHHIETLLEYGYGNLTFDFSLKSIRNSDTPDVEPMKTTLHQRANPGYDPRIRTFRVKEPLSDYIQRKKELGINGENGTAIEQ